MAPSFRGRGATRGQSRGGNRGALRGRERGRGSGRGDYGARAGGNRSIFYSTRVEEQPAEISEEDGKRSSQDDQKSIQELPESLSESDDEDVQKNTVQPYNALLLSLNAKVEQGEPQRKKRRTDSTARQEELEEHEDHGIEPEEDDDLGDSEVEVEVEDVDEVEIDVDAFSKHISESNSEELEQKIHAVKNNTWSTEKRSKQLQWSHTLMVPTLPELTASPRFGTISSTGDMMLKQRLREPAEKVVTALDKLSGNVASAIFNYRDLLFPQRNLENSETIRKLTCLHALNHVFKTRDKVINDNARLSREDVGENIELRDQGFTRPKILMIMPTRNSCVKYVDTIVSLCEPEQQENKKRFQETYVSTDQASESKPEDFRELFAGNDNDMFRLGLKFTRKTVKFFSQFYNSDIIFASPLGLRMALGADDPKKQDHDFLSSIELVVVDQAEAMLMQNWEHVEYIFEHLNLQPREAHGCNFSRVREWYLDGNAKYLRQTILLSSFNFPSLNKLYAHHMLNVAGKLKYSSEQEGAMVDLGISSKQTFSRFEFGTPVDEPENRFKYFTTTTVPSMTKYSKHGGMRGQGVLIYLPSYADFVRVRNYLASSLATQDISFGSVSEYTPAKDVARARSHFLSGRHSVLLYTERAHHFRRYHLKGVKRVILYGLPENPIFYKEVVGGYLGASIAAAKLDAREATARALFSRLDILKLERIVGSGRYLSMLKEKRGDTFDFV